MATFNHLRFYEDFTHSQRDLESNNHPLDLDID
jgi:hypothetical protein